MAHPPARSTKPEASCRQPRANVITDEPLSPWKSGPAVAVGDRQLRSAPKTGKREFGLRDSDSKLGSGSTSVKALYSRTSPRVVVVGPFEFSAALSHLISESGWACARVSRCGGELRPHGRFTRTFERRKVYCNCSGGRSILSLELQRCT
jgi:hypothetical protein